MASSGMKWVQWILFSLLAFLIVSWWLATAEILDLSGYYEITFGLAAASILLIESGIYTYFAKSQYRSIGYDDFVTYFLAVSGASLLLQSVAAIPKLGIVLPEGLSDFLLKINFVVGIIAMAVMLMSVYKLNKRG